MVTTPWENPAPRPSVDERYEGAANTSDLTVGGGMIPKDHRAGAGDVVAAAGLVGGRLKRMASGDYVLLPPNDSSIGMALLRLHSEWTAAAKPRRVGPEVVEKLAEDVRRQDAIDAATAERKGEPYERPGSALGRANAEAARWYRNELILLAQKLKSRADVVGQLTQWATLKEIDPETVSAALLHWLDPICPECDGHGIRFMEHQAARQCHRCNGGERKRTAGVDRVLRQIDYALGIARGRLSQRLRRG